MTTAPNSTRHAIRDSHGRFRRDVNAEVVAELHERLRRETARSWGFVDIVKYALGIALIGIVIAGSLGWLG